MVNHFVGFVMVMFGPRGRLVVLERNRFGHFIMSADLFMAFVFSYLELLTHR